MKKYEIIKEETGKYRILADGKPLIGLANTLRGARMRVERLRVGETLPKTYGESLRAGWVHTSTALERGYISRKINPADQKLWIAGGNANGQVYVCLPNWRSTYYGVIRQYLRAPSK